MNVCIFKLAILGMTLSLGACGATSSIRDESPPSNSGPKFAPSEVRCGPKATPPDPEPLRGKPAGKIGAKFENAQDDAYDRCASKMDKVRRRLEGGGQIVQPGS